MEYLGGGSALDLVSDGLSSIWRLVSCDPLKLDRGYTLEQIHYNLIRISRPNKNLNTVRSF